MKLSTIWLCLGLAMVIVLLIISIPAYLGAVFVTTPQLIIPRLPETYIKGELPHHDDMTYFPHYVKIHIVPEEPGLTVITKMEGSIFSEIRTTDNNSEIVMEMVSAKMYKVDIRGHSYFIYPSQSYYTIMTGER